MTKPQLSICIPTYNRADLLRETLAHLKDVCDDDVEITISDNFSPDNTQDVINSFSERFRHFRAIRQTTNRGAMKNFAAAISLARGKYLYPLSDDDQIYMQGLQKAISIMEERPIIVAVFGSYEEWVRSTGAAGAIKFVNQRIDFAQGGKMEIINAFNNLWHPVCRTDIFHRFCSFEKNSLSFWGIVGSLIKHGDVSIIPDLFYKHAHTEPRLEYELTEGWYHDAMRADLESYFGRMGQVDPPDSLAVWLYRRVTHAYLQGFRFSEIKGDLLTARRFLLRSRGYGEATKEMLEAWEKQSMVGMLAERLLQKIELLPEIDEVVFEASSRLQALHERLAAIAPKYSMMKMSEEAFRQCGLRSNQFFVTINYGSFESGAMADCDLTHSIAMVDLIETCRLTDQPLGD